MAGIEAAHTVSRGRESRGGLRHVAQACLTRSRAPPTTAAAMSSGMSFAASLVMRGRRQNSTELFVAAERAATREELEESERERAAPVEHEAHHDHVLNSSPWSIGMSHHDQRDLYTTNASTDEDGYGCGPSHHPAEGSYAYHREFHPGTIMLREGNANLYEREAWPWLNYSVTDPYFAHIYALHDEDHEDTEGWAHSHLQSIKARASSLASRIARAFGRSEPPPPGGTPRTDAQLRWDVERALLRREDLDDRDIVVDVVRAEATLEGTVPDRRSKRAAGRIAAQVASIRAVHNHLEIRADDTIDADVALASPFAFSA